MKQNLLVHDTHWHTQGKPVGEPRERVAKMNMMTERKRKPMQKQEEEKASNDLPFLLLYSPQQEQEEDAGKVLVQDHLDVQARSGAES